MECRESVTTLAGSVLSGQEANLLAWLRRWPSPAMDLIMPKNRRDESWFYEASTRFFSSLLWATMIIGLGTVVVYLTTHVL